MKIVSPSVEFIKCDNQDMICRLIEIAGRTCYKSDHLINAFSAPEFCHKIIRSGHDSVLEHANITVKLICDRGVSHEIVRHRLCSYSQESTRYCVAGHSILTPKNHTYSNITVKDLFLKKEESKNGSWKRINIRQVDEKTGEIKYSKIKNVFYTGKKETIKLKTKLGYEIEVTPDHSIKTLNGYVKASETLGLKIATNGTNLLYRNKDWLKYQYNTLNKTSVQISSEFGFNVSTIKKWKRIHDLSSKPKSYFNIGRIPWNKGLTEKKDKRVKRQGDALRKYHWVKGNPDEGKPRGERVKKLSKRTYHKLVGTRCAICGEDKKHLIVHHINEDREDNTVDNLITLCFRCHSGLHNKTNQVVFYDDVVSITPAGIQDVFDIEMLSDDHNFIINGVCVHNCNYSKNKFGDEITVIRPLFWEETSPCYWHWEQQMLMAERAYLTLIACGAKAQEARSVLPNSLKTEIVMTANIREWRHIFNLRTAPQSHPQMIEIMKMLQAKFQERLPIFFK